ncbi:MAG TPA: AAA family ATPase [Gemmataceae bacterium]|nr:AAA family ATPase [Gemmataceae bacterium]
MAKTEPAAAWDACPVGDFTPEPVEWLWQYRLPLGRPAILEGDPDLKKSYVTLDLCARLSTGRPFPDGSPSPGPANSLVLNAEDRVEDTIATRLRALEADVKRVFVLRPTDEALPRRFCLLAQLQLLDELLARIDARLLVVDPVVAFVDAEINWTNDQSVRRLLVPLGQVAMRRRCAMVLIRHLNKSGGSNALYRGGGAIGVVSSCRAAWVVGRDPNQPERSILAQVKNNITQDQPSLIYGLEPAGPNETPRLSWLGTSPLTAKQLLAAQNKTPSRRQRAREFLRAFLKDGPRTAREIWSAGLEQELSQMSFQRARKALQIKSTVVVKDHGRQTYWLLPGQKLPPEIDPAADPNSVAAFRAAWLAEYPEPTPLDQ